MSEIYSSLERPLPARKRKGRTKRVVHTAEFKKLTKKILDGQLGVKEAIYTTLVPDDAERFGSKEPARSLALALKDFIKKQGFEAEYNVQQYQPLNAKAGEWVVQVEYAPPESDT